MSNLATAVGDDFPEAAEKNLHDARCLLHGGRSDGAAYHAGYVVECSLKALLLVDILRQRAGTLSAVAASAGGLIKGDSAVKKRLEELRQKPFGHRIENLRKVSVGVPVPPAAAAVIASGTMARYLSRALHAPRPSKIFSGGAGGWSETLRYQRSGVVSKTDARRWCDTAETVYRQSVLRLRLDGVVTR